MMGEHCDFENESDFIDAYGCLNDTDRSDLVDTKDSTIKTLKVARKWVPNIDKDDLPIVVKKWEENGELLYDVFCATYGHFIYSEEDKKYSEEDK